MRMRGRGWCAQDVGSSAGSDRAVPWLCKGKGGREELIFKIVLCIALSRQRISKGLKSVSEC